MGNRGFVFLTIWTRMVFVAFGLPQNYDLEDPLDLGVEYYGPEAVEEIGGGGGGGGAGAGEADLTLDEAPEETDISPDYEPAQPKESSPQYEPFSPEVPASFPESSSSSSSSSSAAASHSVRDGSCSPLHYPCGQSYPDCCEDTPICKCDRLHFCSCRYRAGPVRPPIKYVPPKCQKMYHPCGEDFPKCCDEVPVCHCFDDQKWRCICVEEYKGSKKQGEEETKEVGRLR